MILIFVFVFCLKLIICRTNEGYRHKDDIFKVKIEILKMVVFKPIRWKTDSQLRESRLPHVRFLLITVTCSIPEL